MVAGNRWCTHFDYRVITVLRYLPVGNRNGTKRCQFFSEKTVNVTPIPRVHTRKHTTTMSGKTMTGREKSKSALKSEKKNADCASEYVYHVESIKVAKDADDLEPDGQRVARVIKALGAGRLEVQFPDGTEEKPAIAKKIRFHGRAATKGDQSNCMGPGDLVIVDGGFLFGKLSNPQAARVGAVFKRHGIDHPSGFFASSARTVEEQMGDVVEWDRSVEEAAEEKAAKEREFQEAENRRKWRPDMVPVVTDTVEMAEPTVGPTVETEEANDKPWLGKRGGKRVAAEAEVDA
jgi:hypothetical protein